MTKIIAQGGTPGMRLRVAELQSYRVAKLGLPDSKFTIHHAAFIIGCVAFPGLRASPSPWAITFVPFRDKEPDAVFAPLSSVWVSILGAADPDRGWPIYASRLEKEYVCVDLRLYRRADDQ